MTTDTIKIETLDEGVVVTQDGKRKAMTDDELKGFLSLMAFQYFNDLLKERGTSEITFTIKKP